MRVDFNNSFKLSGRVYKLGEREQVNANFAKRELVLAVAKTEALGPEIGPELLKIEFSQDAIAALDAVQLGDDVIVHFYIEGRTWERNQQTHYFVVLSGWRVEQEGEDEPSLGIIRLPTAAPGPPEQGPF